MKTRDRILQTSLALFNEEGEASQSAVDIANALEMSPGNLYYHFKGKDAIIRALYDNFEHEMRIILRGSRGRITSIEDNWVYTYIILEEIFDFRFFYRNLGELLARYPDLAVRFRALLAEKRQTVHTLLSDLNKRDVLFLGPRMAAVITDQILSALTFWLSLDFIEGKHTEPSVLIHKTVFSIMSLVAPHMGKDGFDIMQAMMAYYDKMVGQ
ncbi:MAG: TetR/AcrR family transcriptional regulator [Robiginitomaculum sp.]|nr:TetR/AcrR family transcriptional regulator [Robiginitomaculum sp.]MDQ7077481.1 TetR/AcrR family transcriptional regulator [Robiginitomaculum sp.]